MPLTLLVPVYNDWPAVARLVEELERELRAHRRAASLLIVDDGSSTSPGPALMTVHAGFTSFDILHLRTNLGHQRAIAVGLAYLEAERSPEAVVVMDGDGEDRPEDVEKLAQALERDGAARIVFAERTRRSEGMTFAMLYWFYRVVHRALTGERVRVGNFSIIPAAQLRRLVAVSDLWNHFAAAVFHARIPFTTIPTVRGERYAGKSQMNFVGLVTHGLSAMSVFGDRIGVRLLLLASAVTLAGLLTGSAIAIWHVASGAPLSMSPVYAVVPMVMLLLLAVATSLAFVFIILAGRGNQGFLPFRQYRDYVDRITSVATHERYAQQPVPRN